MLEKELDEANSKGKAVGVFKVDLDKIKNEINLLEEKFNKEKVKTTYLE